MGGEGEGKKREREEERKRKDGRRGEGICWTNIKLLPTRLQLIGNSVIIYMACTVL